MKRKKERSRATHVADDNRKRRLHLLFKVCAVLLLPTLYLFYSLSGLYLVDVEISNLKEQIIWCLLHPLKVYNDKSYSMVLVGGLLWMICSFQAYSKTWTNFLTFADKGDYTVTLVIDYDDATGEYTPISNTVE